MQVREQPVDAVGHRRAGRATGLVARAEHEVVDEQLGSSLEQLDQRLLAVVRVEAVLLLHPHPGQLASLPRELVTDIGSGKISSSRRSTPSKMPRATASGEVFGMSRSRTTSVSIGPAMTACTRTPRPARRARSDCESENAAAFEIEQAGRTGTAANAATETTLTTAPPVRVSSGRNASVTPHVPKRTARCCSSTARSLNQRAAPRRR